VAAHARRIGKLSLKPGGMAMYKESVNSRMDSILPAWNELKTQPRKLIAQVFTRSRKDMLKYGKGRFAKRFRAPTKWRRQDAVQTRKFSASVDGGKGKENHIILMVSMKLHMRWVEAS